MNFQQAKRNMVTQQIRSSYVLDQKVLSVIQNTAREIFVPPALENLAYADTQLPIEHGQVMMSPREEGLCLQALNIKPDDRVLEVGTGTGYFTCLLAQLAKEVVSIDIFEEFIKKAHTILTSTYNLLNCNLQVGDASNGWGTYPSYDVIIITGSLPYLPSTFINQLTTNGRLFAIIGKEPIMTAKLITRHHNENWKEHFIFETNIKPLISKNITNKFTF